MARLVKSGFGKIIIVDAGMSQNDSSMSKCLAWPWADVLGDYMRDEDLEFATRRDVVPVKREDFGPWKCVHVTVPTKK